MLHKSKKIRKDNKSTEHNEDNNENCDTTASVSKEERRIQRKLRKKEKKLLKQKQKQEKLHSKFPSSLMNLIEHDLDPLKDNTALNEISKAKVSRNPILCNQIITKYGQQKKFDVALTMFFEMLASKIVPTIYTFTNLINACVRCGELSRALHYFEEMKKVNIHPNEITYTVLIKGFSQDGMIEKAIELLDIMEQDNIQPNIRTFNTLLRGCLRCGSYQTPDIFLKMKRKLIEPDVSSYEYYIRYLCQRLEVKKTVELAKELESKNIFHAPIYSSIAIASALKGKRKTAVKMQKKALDLMKEKRINTKGYENKESVGLFLNLINEEIENDCGRIKNYLETKKELKKLPKYSFPDDTIILINNLNSFEKIDLDKYFINKTSIYLEICSGHGDWIVDKAKNTKGQINWVALEIRYERVFQIWTKLKFNNLDNLIVICGEANDVLRNYTNKSVFKEIFINYPDPPVWEKSTWLLIQASFLAETYKTLQKGGSLTVVTDNRGYSKKIVEEFKKLPHLYGSSFEGKDFLNEVPTEYGSSYFDRFWMNGKKTERFFIKYLKLVSKGNKTN